MIDPTFRNIKMVVYSFIRKWWQWSYKKIFFWYYMPLVEIKDFNVLINNKPLFDQSLKNKKETYEKLVEISRNDEYTTENELDYLYHQKYYKLIGTDLSRQINTSITPKINFIGKFEENGGTKMFFIAEKQQKNHSKLCFRFIKCNRIT